MAVVRLKGLKRYRSKNGVWYSYHRASGTRIEPPHAYGTTEFVSAYLAADRKWRSKAPREDSVGNAIAAYRASREFQQLAARTKKDYDGILNWLGSLDQMPLSEIDSPFVAKLRDVAFAKHKRRFANYVLAVLSNVFRHCIELGTAKSNPVKGVAIVRRPYGARVMNRAWTKEEKDVVLRLAPPQLLGPIAFARWTGARQGDVLKLPKTTFHGGSLEWRSSKRGVPVRHECPAELRQVLEQLSPHPAITLFANSNGRPWTGSGFRASFYKFIKRLETQGLVGLGLTFHGLRTSIAEELRERGIDFRTIADALGQRDTQTAEYYARNADLRASSARVKQALESD